MLAHTLRRVARTIALSLSLIAPLCLLPACASSGANASASIAEDYEAGRYEEAYKRATQVAERGSGKAKEEAALYAGLSAQRLGDTANAEKYLTPLTRSADRSIAGRASAALGLLEMDNGNHRGAVTLFNAASNDLTGDDAARAAFYEGQCWETLGDTGKAEDAYTRASGMANNQRLRDDIDARLADLSGGGMGGATVAGGGSGGYSIQLGLFSNRANADRLAQSSAGTAQSLGLGAPRVAAKRDAQGRQMWAVFVGRFQTLEEASRLRKNFGGGAFAAAATD